MNRFAAENPELDDFSHEAIAEAWFEAYDDSSED